MGTTPTEESKVAPLLVSRGFGSVRAVVSNLLPGICRVGQQLVSAMIIKDASTSEPINQPSICCHQQKGVPSLASSNGSRLDEESAAASPSKGVSLGMAYHVCADRGAVIDVREATAGDEADDLGGRSASFQPTLEKAFSSKTGEAVSTSTVETSHTGLAPFRISRVDLTILIQLRLSRGKSYEGEHFSLSWSISLAVPVGKKKGCTKPQTKTILDGIGACGCVLVSERL